MFRPCIGQISVCSQFVRGQRSVVSGQSPVVSGQWSVVSQWSVASRQWVLGLLSFKFSICDLQFAICNFPLPFYPLTPLPFALSPPAQPSSAAYPGVIPESVMKVVVFVITKQQSAKAYPAALWLRVTANYHFLLVAALKLQPVAGAFMRVLAFGPFGDEPFQTLLARLFEECFAALILVRESHETPFRFVFLERILSCHQLLHDWERPGSLSD